ncbi:hypothetical protein [Mucilaginibacter gotjawali]|uniref:Uncharacterized protein n=2 Tax=Mucilaginibacter gotjawali TaxID=1550579 RepID=A0A110B206_9SPHI|nr:hypothetical protein [Mucilaginibacter gotjawali]MBB3055647.1 hypothetical protein [Mucilaginibacter gotjawali]BAU53068.1 hypothetical protein MgSA37_01235 [Mucilaginibacter gotjawali]
MYRPRLIAIPLILLFLSFRAYGQQVKADTSVNKQAPKTLFVNAGLQYLSQLTYAGRRAASSVPVLLPTFTLISTKGFFVAGIGYFDLNGSKSAAEGLSITPGYVFSFDKKKEFGGVISATKYFITNNSPIILSSFDATIDGQLHYNPDNIVKLTVDGSYRFSKSGPNDVINDAELSKEIQVTKNGNNKDGLKVTPTVTLYSGTQSFYKTVDSTLSNSSVLKNILSPGQTTTTQSKQVTQYTILALSGSLQLAYVIKSWQINFTPYLIQPYHQVNYANNTPQNGSYFLFTTGVSVTF